MTNYCCSLDLDVDKSNNNVLSVSALNKNVRLLLEQQIGTVWVSGEISNFVRAQSGHWYFTLKDAHSQVKGACFRGNNQRLGFLPKNGDKILARARVALYEPRGDYQIVAEFMEADGDGLLKLKFEQLKQALNQQGLFSQSHKKPLPTYPKTVGIVTSATGAAVHDIINVLKRRAPNIAIIIYPTRVQGQGSNDDISNAIALANQRNEVDILVVGRGGGSLEDLWSFNCENVAQAIFDSNLPIISAVGHEVDITIADYVADHRASTPSVAGEILSQNQTIANKALQQFRAKLASQMQILLHRYQQQQQRTQARLSQNHPVTRLQQQSQKLDLLEQRCESALNNKLLKSVESSKGLKQRLNIRLLHQSLSEAKQQCSTFNTRLYQAISVKTQAAEQQIRENSGLLNTLNPLNTLSRGYSVSYVNDKPVTSLAQVAVGDMLTTHLSNGTLTSKVLTTNNNAAATDATGTKKVDSGKIN